MLQSGFGGHVLRGLRQLALAQRRQQVACDDDALPALLGPKAQVAQPFAAVTGAPRLVR